MQTSSTFTRKLGRLVLLGTALAGLGAATNSWAQGGSAGMGDSHFASEAASGGMAEVRLGQLAQTNGSSDAVKEFGRRMETDHGKAGDELKEAAQKDGIQLPSGLSIEDQATYDRLSKLQGASFDKAYATAMVKDHKKDIAAFEKEAASGKNAAIKNFAQQALPTLKDHLKQAQEMAKTVTASR